MANVQLGEKPTAKENAIYWLKTLLELVENDQIRADEVSGIFAAEVDIKKAFSKVIELAELKADQAIANAGNLADGN